MQFQKEFGQPEDDEPQRAMNRRTMCDALAQPGFYTGAVFDIVTTAMARMLCRDIVVLSVLRNVLLFRAVHDVTDANPLILLHEGNVLAVEASVNQHFMAVVSLENIDLDRWRPN